MAELELRRWRYIDLSTSQEVIVRKKRTGPYRLANGDWSDGICRKKPIGHQLSCDEAPTRMYVWSYHSAQGDKRMWAVGRTEPYEDRDFSQFEDAIAYADKYARMARTNQGENNV